jgi:hypothetical protein
VVLVKEIDIGKVALHLEHEQATLGFPTTVNVRNGLEVLKLVPIVHLLGLSREDDLFLSNRLDFTLLLLISYQELIALKDSHLF